MTTDDRKCQTKRPDVRRAGTLESMPDELFEEFKAAIELYAREDDES